MIFGQDRDELRQMYFDAWRKARENAPLSALEEQIAAVIEMHPEYHAAMIAAQVDDAPTLDGSQSNPFLHMGLHLAVREQLGTNRPAGIRDIFSRIAAGYPDLHAAEHAVIECLAETLWEAQSNNELPDDAKYIERLRAI